MTLMTVTGWLADDLGFVWGSTVALGARSYNYKQAAEIPVLVGHRGARIGQVVHLEYAYKKLFACATVDPDLLDGADVDDERGALWYFSPCTDYNRARTEVKLVEVSLTTSPGTVAADPLHFHVGEPSDLARQSSCPPLIRNAVETIRQRGRGPLCIRGIPDPDAIVVGPMRYTVNGPMTAPIRYSGALGDVLRVR